MRGWLLVAGVCLLVPLIVSGAATRPEPVTRGEAMTGVLVFVALGPKVCAEIAAAAREVGVPEEIALRLAYFESKGNLRAVNTNTNGTVDEGVFQLNSAFHAYFIGRYNKGKRFDPFDVKASSRVALRYLADLHWRLGSWKIALIAYNCGPGRAVSDDVPASSIQHAKKILAGFSEGS